MLVRTVVGFIMAAVLVVVLFLGEKVFGLMVAVLAVIGTLELYKATRTHDNHPIDWAAGLFAVPILLYTIADKFDYITICFYGIATIVALVCLYRSKKYSIIDGIITVFSGIVVSSMFYTLLTIYKLGEDKLTCAALLFVVLIGAWATDICAYLVGVTMGKHKLCPAISPKKSVEGSIGGIVGVVIVLTLYCRLGLARWIPAFAEVPVYAYILLGIACGVLSQAGDLTASMVKRHFGVKDYGKIFPGHGGVLDRFDSLFFVAPAVYFFLRVAVYIAERGIG